LTKGVPFDPSFDEILDAAIDLYGQMIRDNSWLGSKHKARETAFPAQINAADKRNPTKTVALTCWNCGKIGHRLNECRRLIQSAKNVCAKNFVPTAAMETIRFQIRLRQTPIAPMVAVEAGVEDEAVAVAAAQTAEVVAETAAMIKNRPAMTLTSIALLHLSKTIADTYG
jgi:hypothetical protein